MITHCCRQKLILNRKKESAANNRESLQPRAFKRIYSHVLLHDSSPNVFLKIWSSLMCTYIALMMTSCRTPWDPTQTWGKHPKTKFVFIDAFTSLYVKMADRLQAMNCWRQRIWRAMFGQSMTCSTLVVTHLLLASATVLKFKNISSTGIRNFNIQHNIPLEHDSQCASPKSCWFRYVLHTPMEPSQVGSCFWTSFFFIWDACLSQ